jgi:hypothetical protein
MTDRQRPARAGLGKPMNHDAGRFDLSTEATVKAQRHLRLDLGTKRS